MNMKIKLKMKMNDKNSFEFFSGGGRLYHEEKKLSFFVLFCISILLLGKIVHGFLPLYSCTFPYSLVMYCAVVYFTPLHSTEPHCTLHCTTRHYTVHYTVLHFLHCTLHCTALYYTKLQTVDLVYEQLG